MIETTIGSIKGLINWISAPYYFVSLSIILIWAMLRWRGWAKPRAFALVFLAFAGFYVVSTLDHNFRKIVVKADNIPIAGMLFMVIFFIWLALRQAFHNDERIAAGKGPMEASESKDKLLCWPHLVYTEFICLILLTVVLLAWSILIQAPI